MPDETSSVLVLSANTRWVYALAESLAASSLVHAVRFYDWRTYWNHDPAWPESKPPETLRRTLRVMPTGYAGRLEPLTRPWLRHLVRRWQQALREQTGDEPYVVAPYPYLAPWVSHVPDGRLIYYNLDAYTLYQPARAAWIRERESQLVGQAWRTLCLSQFQVRALRDRHPDAVDRIHHFPLGVVEEYLNPDPTSQPEPNTVGYVGNLTDRVDWVLVDAVAKRCPDLTFVFVGGIEDLETGGTRTGWERERQIVLSRSNVRHVGRVPQDDVPKYYWNFSATWIPYDVNHPFNRASCPTKVMDTIASGRPVVSTDVPECRLYPEWIAIANTPDAVADALHDAVGPVHSDRAPRQVEFARTQTWAKRAETFWDLVSSPTSSLAASPAPS